MNKNPAGCIMTLEAAVRWREQLKRDGKTLVVTNGCFDILHRGHAEYMYEARELGDALLVLINSDASVRSLKGPSRPIIDQYNRAYMLAALASVDAVVVFDGSRCDRELAALAADRYVKGGDYTLDKLDPTERAALESAGTEVCFKPFIPGFSTTTIVERIRASETNSFPGALRGISPSNFRSFNSRLARLESETPSSRSRMSVFP